MRLDTTQNSLKGHYMKSDKLRIKGISPSESLTDTRNQIIQCCRTANSQQISERYGELPIMVMQFAQ